jgi:hypothetical protein
VAARLPLAGHPLHHRPRMTIPPTPWEPPHGPRPRQPAPRGPPQRELPP